MGTIGGQGWVGTWNADAFISEVNMKAVKGVGKAAALLVRDAKFLVSRPGVKKSTPFGTTNLGGEEVSRGTEGGDITRISRPGEPPRKRTGELMGSIHMEKLDRIGLRYKVGSPLPYALALELGYEGRNLKPRPFLRAALERMRHEMSRVMLATMASTKYKATDDAVTISSELTTDDIARGKKNKFYQEAPQMGQESADVASVYWKKHPRR